MAHNQEQPVLQVGQSASETPLAAKTGISALLITEVLLKTLQIWLSRIRVSSNL